MGRQAAGESLAIQLARAETAVEQAMAEVALFAALLPGARTAAQLSATTGQPIFEATARAMTSLTETRSHMVEAHRKLEALARRIALDRKSTRLNSPLIWKPSAQWTNPTTRRPSEAEAQAPLQLPRTMVNKSLPDTLNAC